MATYSLISMGAVLNDPCRPANVCRGPVELKNGDLYYDSNWPNKILSFNGSYSNPTEFATLQNGDIIINETSGLKYHYSLTDGVVFDTFAWPDHTYIILGEISGTITIPANCTLIFEGGKFAGSLTGDNTTIDASPVQIFDEDITLDGTFTNECAYPEWWGAKRMNDMLPELSDPNHDSKILGLKINCAKAIQKAFDSVFGEIRFSTGLYYVAPVNTSVESILTLKYSKRLTMHGTSQKSHNEYYDDMDSTVIWTDQDKNVIEVCLTNRLNPGYKLSQPTKFAITGGEINVSKCETFTHAAILIHPTAINGCLLTTTLIGPVKNPHSQKVSMPNAYGTMVTSHPVIWNYTYANFVDMANNLSTVWTIC